MQANGTKNLEGKPEARFFYLSPLLDLAPINLTEVEKICVETVEEIHKALLKGSEDLTFVICEALRRLSDQIDMNEFIKGVNTVSKVGAKNHGLFNYKKGLKASLLVDAMYRHAIKLCLGYVRDEESNENHIYHILANMFMLYYNVKRNNLNDLIEENL